MTDRFLLCFIALASLASMTSHSQDKAPGGVIPRDEMRRIDQLNRLPFTATLKKRMCVMPLPTADADIDVHRSLFVHDRATLDSQDFSLGRTFGQLATQAGATVPGLNATALFRQFWDTQDDPPGVTTGPHCTANFNGFPQTCPRGEHSEASGTNAQVLARMNRYRVLALVNRLDLAHEGWRNCGEYRIVYGVPPDVSPGGEVDFARNLIIFEAVLPNPKPGCRSSCAEVAKFWKSLSTIADPVQRGELLEAFFYGPQKGGPDVLPGFRPVVHIDHYSVNGVSSGTYGGSGSGQIRTNQFLAIPWMLREFKTASVCTGPGACSFNFVQVPVKVNPFGTLWNEDLANAAGPHQLLAQSFQNEVLSGVPQLADGDLMKIGYSVALKHDAGQSISQGFEVQTEKYLNEFNSATGPVDAFRVDLAADALAHGLSAPQIVNRALSQSCHGCHRPSAFGLRAPNAIGPATLPNGGSTNIWPNALPFVHVETVTDPNLFLGNPEFGTGSGQPISPALNDVFLPARKNFLVSQLNKPQCLCTNNFAALPDIPRLRAERILADIDPRFEPRIAEASLRLSKALRAGKPERELGAEKKALAAVTGERDAELAKRLRAIGVTQPVMPMNTVKPLALAATPKAPGKDKDKSKASTDARLVQQRVLEIIDQEPPRRTVTGSFSPH
jgi:hypothetical protein